MDMSGDYQEIDLRDIVNTLLKHKKAIAAVTAAAAIAALAASFALPKVFEIKTALEVGVIVAPGTQEALESSVQLQEKINNDVYGHIVRRELEIAEKDYPKIKVENLKDTAAIFISANSSNIDQTKTILAKINSLILTEHRQKLEIAKKEFEARIEIEERNIKRLQNKIESLGQEKTAIEGKILVLQALPITGRDAGTQFALFDNKEQLEKKVQEIEDTYQAVNSGQALINSLRRQIDQSKATAVIQEPSVSERAVSPRPLLNAVLAAVLGLFVAIFGVFIVEWWKGGKV